MARIPVPSNIAQGGYTYPSDLLSLYTLVNGNLDQTNLVSGLIANNVSTFTAAGSLTATQAGTVLANTTSGAFTITLPPSGSSSVGLQYLVMKTDSSANAVTIAGNGADTINGAATTVLPVQYQAVLVVNQGGGVWDAVPYIGPAITNVTQVTATTNLTASQAGTVLANTTSGAFSIILPPSGSSSVGLQYLVMKTDATGNAVTVTGNGTDTINGAATTVLSVQYQSVLVINKGGGAWAATEDVALGQSLNHGTLTDVTTSRAFGTTYTNSTPRPIRVFIEATATTSGAAMQFNINSSPPFVTTQSTSNDGFHLSFIVLPGETYQATNINSSLTDWYEG